MAGESWRRVSLPLPSGRGHMRAPAGWGRSSSHAGSHAGSATSQILVPSTVLCACRGDEEEAELARQDKTASKMNSVARQRRSSRQSPQQQQQQQQQRGKEQPAAGRKAVEVVDLLSSEEGEEQQQQQEQQAGRSPAGGGSSAAASQLPSSNSGGDAVSGHGLGVAWQQCL